MRYKPSVSVTYWLYSFWYILEFRVFKFDIVSEVNDKRFAISGRFTD